MCTLYLSPQPVLLQLLFCFEKGSDMERFGVLEDVQVLGEGYHYQLVVGANRDGEVRQVCTRGPGRSHGATRIPIGVDLATARSLLERHPSVFRQGDFMHLVASVSLGIPLEQFCVHLMQMSREGNLVSGWEWNVPGGTGEPGESPERIADREFSEESDFEVLAVGTFLPPWLQFASGCYDEVQTISFALVTGNPQKLVEGARRWTSVPLYRFIAWACSQNQRDDSSRWETSEFIPVDGKVLLSVWLLLGRLL